MKKQSLKVGCSSSYPGISVQREGQAGREGEETGEGPGGGEGLLHCLTALKLLFFRFVVVSLLLAPPM